MTCNHQCWPLRVCTVCGAETDYARVCAALADETDRRVAMEKLVDEAGDLLKLWPDDAVGNVVTLRDLVNDWRARAFDAQVKAGGTLKRARAATNHVRRLHRRRTAT